jgi:membrane complex biogenesis BtpA family protein
MKKIVRHAVDDARAYIEAGVDGIVIENMHDAPYINGYAEPETTAAMTAVSEQIRKETRLPLGIQILAGANIEALGVAIAASLDFIRVEGFVFAHVGDEGIHESCAAKLIRRRANLRAQHIQIFADIKKKHSAHAITADVSLAETAHAAEFFQADGVIITGGATGIAPEPEDVEIARNATSLKVMVGSGVTAANIHQFSEHADALIVGSSLKFDGNWKNHVDPVRVKALVDQTRSKSMKP